MPASTLLHVPVDVSADASPQTLAPATEGWVWTVLAFMLDLTDTVEATVTTEETGTALFVTSKSVMANYCPEGHFKSLLGESLQIDLDDDVAVTGYFVIRGDQVA